MISNRLLLCALWCWAPLLPAATIVTWSPNTLEWNERLGVEEVRLGCSSEPAACLESLRRIAREQHTDRLTLAITADPLVVAEYASRYSEASLAEPRLVGIGIDDFFSAYLEWAGEPDVDELKLFERVVANAKSHNPELEFGLTLYEDELDSELLSAAAIPLSLRQQIDRVSLFLHFAANGPGYRDYVDAVRLMFPNAHIHGGVYAYDRIDYLPCAERKKRKCSRRKQRTLFKETIEQQVAMLETGELDGLEFYPGHFGSEATWKGWANPDICRASRREDCVANTRELREIAVRRLESLKAAQTEEKVRCSHESRVP